MIGSSPAELETAAQTLSDVADWVGRSGQELSASLGVLSWAGAAALQFTDMWSSRYRPAMMSTESFLRRESDRLRVQARQQRTASGGRISAIASAVGGATHGGATTPRTSNLWSRRDQVNRDQLEVELARLRAEYEDYAKRGEKFGGHFTNDDRRAELLQQKVEALEAIQRALKDHPERHLLMLDLSGRTALAAIGVGDADHARNVAVFTGGVGTDVATDVESKADDMDNLRARAGGEDVATIAWLGYEAPPDFRQDDPTTWFPAVTDADDLNKAKVGAASLASFLQQIDGSRSGDVHLTAIGHSYGSTVTALAAAQTPPGVIDELVVVGSPGLGTSVESLQVPDGHTYILEATGDWIADLGSVDGYGGDPAMLDGLIHLDASDSHGHSDYLRDGSRSQASIAGVIRP